MLLPITNYQSFTVNPIHQNQQSNSKTTQSAKFNLFKEKFSNIFYEDQIHNLIYTINTREYDFNLFIDGLDHICKSTGLPSYHNLSFTDESINIMDFSFKKAKSSKSFSTKSSEGFYKHISPLNKSKCVFGKASFNNTVKKGCFIYIPALKMHGIS